MMIMLTILFAICTITGLTTGMLVDLNPDPKPPLILTFFLSIVIGMSAIITFIVGHFMGL